MKSYMFLIILFSFSNLRCNVNNNLPERKENDVFVYSFTKTDSGAAKDIKAALDNNYQRICDDLEYQYRYKIQVNIYPDQKNYDENIVDKELIGSPAYSGIKEMHLVSPQSQIKISGIPYEERLLMAVHEFVHLMVDEINTDLPIWMDEGLAAYEGSSNIYEKFCRLYMPKLPLIGLKDMEESYNKVSGADLYSYSAIRFIIEKFGLKKLNRLLRNPGNYEKIFSISKDQFDKEWHSFISQNWN